MLRNRRHLLESGTRRRSRACSRFQGWSPNNISMPVTPSRRDLAARALRVRPHSETEDQAPSYRPGRWWSMRKRKSRAHARISSNPLKGAKSDGGAGWIRTSGAARASMGGNSARVWRAIRPDKKHPRWREFVRPWIRLCVGSLRFASFAKFERRCSATSERSDQKLPVQIRAPRSPSPGVRRAPPQWR
jgi:hypothetical protein